MNQITVNGKTYEKCTLGKYYKSDNTLLIDSVNEEDMFYREIQKFPMVFENKIKKITINMDGTLVIRKKNESSYVLYFNPTHSLPLLKQAVNRAMEVENEL